MELAQDKLDLIERIIKNDRKFANNEDLYEDFFNETCKRSFIIVKTVDSDAVLESYLRKIATTSILNVLKDSGRLRRTKTGYVPTKEVITDPIEVEAQVSSDCAVESSIDYSSAKISYAEVQVKDTPEDFAIKQEVLNKIAITIDLIDGKEPEKQYLYLYNMRYGKGMTQKEISDALGISQSEVSKRLMKLMGKVKQAFN